MKLLVIEGLDGSGKSTQIQLLKDYLGKSGKKCEYLHFPRTDTPWFGELIARFLRGEFGNLNEVDPYLVAMLYAGDRKDASTTINNWLSEGKTVLLDRYTYSNIAYQCAKMKDSRQQEKLRNWILELEFGYFAIPKPDINIFLDVPAGFTMRKLTSGRIGTDRQYLNGFNDIHESNLDFQMKVRDIYLQVAATDPLLEVVDCSGPDKQMLPPEKIFSKILDVLTFKKLI